MWYEMYNLVYVKRVDFDTDNKFRASLRYIGPRSTRRVIRASPTYTFFYALVVLLSKFVNVITNLPSRTTSARHSQDCAKHDNMWQITGYRFLHTLGKYEAGAQKTMHTYDTEHHIEAAQSAAPLPRLTVFPLPHSRLSNWLKKTQWRHCELHQLALLEGVVRDYEKNPGRVLFISKLS